MRAAVEAEYLAQEQVLERPLDSVKDHERVRVVVEPPADHPQTSILDLVGLGKEVWQKALAGKDASSKH